MTAVECLQALKYGFRHMYLLPFPLWTRIQLMFLKAVAICGYHYGKYLGLQRRASVASPFSWPVDKAAVDYPHSVSRSNYSLHKIAVVLPVYATSQGYARMVVEAVEALSQQTRQLVLVVDDFSPVPLPESIARTVSNGKDSHTTEIRVLKLPHNCGPAAARNEGLVTAKREGSSLVLFLDSDCLPDWSWVEAMEAKQIQSPGIVCGRTLSFEQGSVVGFYHDVCGTLNGRLLQDGSLLYGCTCNLSIDTSEVGFYFDTSFRRAAFEDVEFCVRARKRDIKITYTPKAIMKHRYEPGWWGLFRQFERYGSFEKQMCSKHPEYLHWLWSSEFIPSIEIDDHAPKTVLVSGMCLTG